MATGLAANAWASRAQVWSGKYPELQVGKRTKDIGPVPCGGGSENSISIGVYGVDNPGRGNCLYHAVWVAAWFAGVRQPFGISASGSVFDLRVTVAVNVKQLIDEGKIEDAYRDGSLRVGDLVAEPNQYLRYSGPIPLLAMACILQREIATLCADGVYAVTPCIVPTDVAIREPVVIYHCAAYRPGDRVSFGYRDHYIALYFRNASDRWRFSMELQQQNAQRRMGVNLPMLSKPPKRLADRCSDTSRWKKAEVDSTKRDKLIQPADSEQAKWHKSAGDHETVSMPGEVGSLIARASTLRALTGSDLELLRANFTKHPRLALLYFHCCSSDPAAYICNDEVLRGPGSDEVIERLGRVLDAPIGFDNVQRCQKKIAQSDLDGGDLWACSSCCEFLNTAEDTVQFVPLDKLHCHFLLTPDEMSDLLAIPIDILEQHYQVFRGTNGLLYHLNPDLVSDESSVVLCSACAIDPRKSSFSIASGHDYGRPGCLPELNDVASKCIAPVRSFGLAIVASGKHAIGHSICFPSTGPAACSTVLPCTDMDCIPKVTFIGPREEWRNKQKRYKRLYELPVASVYSWLRVLSSMHTYFTDTGIKVDESAHTVKALSTLQQAIEDSVDIMTSAEASRLDDRVISERFGEEYADGNIDDPVMTKTAVLKAIDGLESSETNAAIDAMLEMVGHTDGVSVVPIRRAAEPTTEWDKNGDMIAGAFPCLFMRGGRSLPRGTWSTAFIRHLMRYYDGRFERSTMLIATLINQLQRHTAVRRAARVSCSRAKVLERLGDLANSEDFTRLLLKAKMDPDSAQARRINAYLLRILSLVGGSVPFSPFERATTRPKIGAMRARYGIAQHWVTIAHPEHHNLELHRIAMLRQEQSWNQAGEMYHRKECTHTDLPETVRFGARGMLSVSNKYPALAARVFERCVRRVQRDIIMCEASTDTRVSRDYGQRQAGAYGTIASFAGVIEPQVDGRLHVHMSLYGSKFYPELLSRISCSSPLRERAAKWLDSVCCTKFGNEVHEWRNKCLARDGRLPKAFEIDIPHGNFDFEQFCRAAQMRAATTNFHAHSSTCFKGKRGKYMCRLARPAGAHHNTTRPLLITRDKLGDMKEGIPAILTAHELPHNLIDAIDNGYSVTKGEAFRPHSEGPLLWELERPLSDAKVVETNLLLAALTCSHTNSSVINGEDSGDMIDEYQQAYMTKDDMALKGAASALYSALVHNVKFPSRADDSETSLRIGQYLATRTVNSFSGAHEWSHSLMVHAITGHRSFVCSETFWYLFPTTFVQYAQQLRTEQELIENAVRSSVGSQDDKHDPELELAELVALANVEDSSKTDSTRVSGGGVRSFAVGKRVVFLTQAESYHHRGEHFAEYTPMEFECIVDILPLKPPAKSGFQKRGRPVRPGFPFSYSHPLFETHHGFLRAKMMTPVLGGPPQPTWSNVTSGSTEKQDKLARYLLSAFTVWGVNGPAWSFDARGLLAVCDKWDRSSASIVDRQRCRFIRNIMRKGFRSSRNEQVATDWRNRGADFWKTTKPPKQPKTPHSIEDRDCEFDGSLPKETDVYKLLCQAAAGSPARRSSIASIKKTFESVFSVVGTAERNTASSTLKSAGPVFPFNTYGGKYNCEGYLSHVAASVQAYDSRNVPRQADSPTFDSQKSDHHNNFDDNDECLIAPCILSNEQFAALNEILSSIRTPGRIKQSLTLVHGGGGTGKSFLVRRVCTELNLRRYQVVATCPTGAGACQLLHGRTFHSAFKCGKSKRKTLSASAAAFLKQLFDPSVVLVVVDEISMFKADYLVLLDERLRQLYDPSKPFGGLSILLTGDFWQLQVVAGTSLCKVMYMRTTDPVLQRAKHLFSLFNVFKLQQQHRASDCKTQQAVLEKFRVLPVLYPAQNYWSKHDAMFRPVDRDILDTITKPLTQADISTDEGWLERSTILVTSNTDRAVLNTCMAKMLSRKGRHLLFRWKKPLITPIPEPVKQMIYNEDEHPELFGYFFCGAPGQILDNANGNVGLGIANGTRCWYHSIGWDDENSTAEAIRLGEEAIERGLSIVDLPFPPQFINVCLADRDGNPISMRNWQPELALDFPVANNVEHHEQRDVVIPLSYVLSNGEHYVTELSGLHGSSQEIQYSQHAVDFAMVLTVWKAQGGTFDHVILLLEGSENAPAWQFEHVYVAVSRVKSTRLLRCFPLSSNFKRQNIYNLKPNIFTIKWFMDIGPDGKWTPHSAAETSCHHKNNPPSD